MGAPPPPGPGRDLLSLLSPGDFSPVGKVTKSTFKKTKVFLKIFPYFLFMFALPLWLVLSKPGRVPCMGRSGYSEYVLKESEALVQGLIGCVGRFLLCPTAGCSVPLRNWWISVYGPRRTAFCSVPLRKRQMFRHAPEQNRAINCVVERSNQQ